MSEKPWYEGIARNEIEGKHVRAVMDSGTVIEGRLAFWGKWLVTAGSPSEGNYVLRGIGESRWLLTENVESLELVWDEHDWGLIDVKDLHHGDAVVANGRLYKVSAIMPGSFYSQVLTDTPLGQCIPVYLVSCALRRKVNVPVKPGFYQDRLGKFWARSVKSTDDGPWWSLELDSLGQPAKSDKDMANLMPLTPAHFAVGEDEESDDAGPFEGLIQYLMPKTSIAGGSTASTGR
ncbi:hypothetical protein [Bifidobacterium asteroides]|uniref:hypothetical protein n=1 Tax=Bifidobacterium asteroides TaxID=1684 RepID=UPI003A7F8C5B